MKKPFLFLENRDLGLSRVPRASLNNRMLINVEKKYLRHTCTGQQSQLSSKSLEKHTGFALLEVSAFARLMKSLLKLGSKDGMQGFYPTVVYSERSTCSGSSKLAKKWLD